MSLVARLELSILPIVSALCFHICCSVGSKCVSTSKAGLDVARKAPLIARAAVAWTFCKRLECFLCRSKGSTH
ncbi:hypothetical protein GGS20DRAFT_562460 [Poronia punctata]|nr:hypothetical protein GGS20DRAFT_562460 [Poronia punctata]